MKTVQKYEEIEQYILNLIAEQNLVEQYSIKPEHGEFEFSAKIPTAEQKKAPASKQSGSSSIKCTYNIW